MKIYYAHSMRKYNTEAETYEISQLSQLLPKCEIVNPNGLVSNMDESYALVDTCDALVFTEYQGHIGKGVYCEIEYALKKHLRVASLFQGKFTRVRSMKEFDVVDVDWGVYYAKRGGRR